MHADAHHPDEDSRKIPVEVANPDADQELIESLPDLVKQSDVYIDESIDEDTILVYPDGTLVPGQSNENVTRSADTSLGH